MNPEHYEMAYDSILDADSAIRWSMEGSTAKKEFEKASEALGDALHWLNAAYEKEHKEE